MPMSYILHRLDDLEKQLVSIKAWVDRANEASPKNREWIRDLEHRLQLLEQSQSKND